MDIFALYHIKIFQNLTLALAHVAGWGCLQRMMWIDMAAVPPKTR